MNKNKNISAWPNFDQTLKVDFLDQQHQNNNMNNNSNNNNNDKNNNKNSNI